MGGAVTIDRETESSSTEGLSGFSRGVVTVCSMTPALVAFRGRRAAGGRAGFFVKLVSLG